MRPGRLMYSDVGDTKMLEKDQTLTLRPIVTDWTRPIVTDRTRSVAAGTLLEMTGRWRLSIRSVEAAASGHHLTVEIK